MACFTVEGGDENIDCRWCGAKPGDVCPICGEPAKIAWGEYYQDDKTGPKGRRCGIDKRTTFSYGVTVTKKHILKMKKRRVLLRGLPAAQGEIDRAGKNWSQGQSGPL